MRKSHLFSQYGFYGVVGPILRFALFVGLIAFIIFIFAPWAMSAPPAHSDPGLAPWFQSLERPGGGLCCSIADCRTVDWRVGKDGRYEVYIDKKDFPVIDSAWVPVPPEAVLKRADNPTGRAVVCFTPALGVMCFIKASMV